MGFVLARPAPPDGMTERLLSAQLQDQVASAEEELENTLSRLKRAEEAATREKARADANSTGELEAQVAAWKEEAEKERKIARDLEETKAALEREKARLREKIETCISYSISYRHYNRSGLTRPSRFQWQTVAETERSVLAFMDLCLIISKKRPGNLNLLSDIV
eukprot:scaffold168829_cov40-Prasinocladus_malaysianus.AAC.2